MPDADDGFDPPTWVGLTVLGSTVLALLSFVLGGALQALGQWFAVLAVLGFVSLLYLWGQQRDPPSRGGGDGDRRERELEAEAGGYGGSGGGG